MEKKILLIILCSVIIGCSYFEGISSSLKHGDPYSRESTLKEKIYKEKKVSKNVENIRKENTYISKNNFEKNKNFDETEEKLVNFIADKVYETPEQVKEITVDGIEKLMKDKNIRMTKREFLARTYHIIRENNMTSYYLATGRLLNQVKK